MTTIGLDDLGTSTTLESNKSLGWYDLGKSHDPGIRQEPRRIWYLLPLESWRILLLTVKKLLIAPGGPYRRLPLAATASTRQASPCISGMVASARRSPLGGVLQAS
jgi:hypothetical protein